MPQHQLHFTAQVDAPLAAVFELFADHRRFSWLFGMPCRVVATGRDEPHGVGSVRRLLAGPLSFDETVIAFERNRAIDYRISRGGPRLPHRDREGRHREGQGVRADVIRSAASRWRRSTTCRRLRGSARRGRME